MKAGLLDAGLALAVFLLYLVTYSSATTSDSATWAGAIEAADREMMHLAAHPLPPAAAAALRALLHGLGLPVPALLVMRTINAALAAAAAVLLARTARLLGSDALLGLATGAALALSFGSWHFANAEVHHWSLALLQLAFLLLVARRARGDVTPRFAAGLGALNAVAIVFHQDAVLFGFAAVTLLLLGRPRRDGRRDAAAYVLAGSAATAVVVVLVAVFVRGLRGPGEIWRWYVWPTWAAGVAVYEIGGVTGSILRTIKAQLTAVHYGTQVLWDLYRDPSMWTDGPTRRLVLLTLLGYALAAGLLLGLVRAGRAGRAPLRAPLAACLVWILVYKVFLNSWFQPASTEYHLATVPPVLLIPLLGAVAWSAAGGAARALARAAVLVAVLSLGVVNLWGAVLPWQRYGQMKESLAARFAPELRAGALFVSSESGLDSVFIGRGRHLGIKEVFKRQARDEGFATIAATLSAQLEGGGRLFLYNYRPNGFTLRRINLVAAARGSPLLSYQDFDAFLAALRERYVFLPVTDYWEEAAIPLVLFGRRSETIWELRPRPAS